MQLLVAAIRFGVVFGLKEPRRIHNNADQKVPIQKAFRVGDEGVRGHKAYREYIHHTTWPLCPVQSRESHWSQHKSSTTTR